MPDRISPRPIFACFGDGSRASEGITSASKPKLLLEFRKIGFVLPKEPSRNYRSYIYMMIFFGWLWTPREFRCVPKFAKRNNRGEQRRGRSHFDGTWAYTGFTNNCGGEVLVSGLYPAV